MQTYYIRSHERITFKRCETRWYWAWRRGLVPKVSTQHALTLGSWFHDALERWYGIGFNRNSTLREQMEAIVEVSANPPRLHGLPDTLANTIRGAANLAVNMARAYDCKYGADRELYIVATEVPLEFELFRDDDMRIMHLLKPDAVVRIDNQYWLLEHKTAKSIRTDHLVIDDQARPYGVMAERALKNKGILGPNDRIEGILYNYIRKAQPDTRDMNADGKYLNKDGSVSKRQPIPQFLRHTVTLTDRAKRITLRRLISEACQVATCTRDLHDKTYGLTQLRKTSHWACPRMCEYFQICSAHESGSDITEMTRSLFRVENPYDYAENTTEIPKSFEM